MNSLRIFSYDDNDSKVYLKMQGSSIISTSNKREASKFEFRYNEGDDNVDECYIFDVSDFKYLEIDMSNGMKFNKTKNHDLNKFTIVNNHITYNQYYLSLVEGRIDITPIYTKSRYTSLTMENGNVKKVPIEFEFYSESVIRCRPIKDVMIPRKDQLSENQLSEDQSSENNEDHRDQSFENNEDHENQLSQKNENHINNKDNVDHVVFNPMKLKLLSGPSSFTCFTLNGIKLLLLGELHINQNFSTDNKAYEIHRWLYDLTVSTTKRINLFLEFDYKNQHGYEQMFTPLFLDNNNSKLDIVPKSPLIILRILFTNRSFENLNVNFIDARTINGIRNPFPKLSDNQETADKFSFSNRDISFDFWRTNYGKLWDYYVGYTNSEEGELLFNRYIELLCKDINIDISFFANYHRYRIEYINLIDKEINKIPEFKTDSKFRFKFFNTIFRATKHYTDVDILTLINMDVHAMLRYLKTNVKNNDRTIFYCGFEHTDTYCNFIKLWFNVEPEIDIRKYDDNKSLESDQFITLNEPFNFLE